PGAHPPPQPGLRRCPDPRRRQGGKGGRSRIVLDFGFWIWDLRVGWREGDYEALDARRLRRGGNESEGIFVREFCCKYWHLRCPGPRRRTVYLVLARWLV